VLAARLTAVASQVQQVAELVARDEPRIVVLAELAAIQREVRDIGLCLLEEDVYRHLTAGDWPSPDHLAALHADLAAGARLSREY
jgi:DNA-binding FrmR family transcriptional regulator